MMTTVHAALVAFVDGTVDGVFRILGLENEAT